MTVAAIEEFRVTLVDRASAFEVVLKEDEVARLSKYYELLLVWNDRLHLVAPCSAAEFASRHVLESLLIVKHLSLNGRVADVGSGAGLPIIPALVLRQDIQAILIESSRKKGVFLREALRATGTLEQAKIFNERFETMPAPAVDYITCRALDRFTELLPQLINWSPRAATMLLFGGESVSKQLGASNVRFSEFRIPESERRRLFVVTREY
jgi:16S rRNA (guanine527-N7)-methyltransferase